MTPRQIAREAGYKDARHHRTLFGHCRVYEFPGYETDYDEGFDEGQKAEQEDRLEQHQQAERID